jgi:DNA primase
MEHEKYSYVESLRWLANKYNVDIEETESSPEVKLQQQVADSLYILNGFAQQFFTNTLLQEEEGQDIGRSYLKERGFGDAIIEKFQLGYCPSSPDQFARKALAAQYSRDLLQKSGLVVFREEKPYDNYRGRIIFPVHNQSGKVAGFGARIIRNNDRSPKYINTPENEIYVKSRILYGSYFARQAIDKLDECLLVEGYTDVISLHQAGIENVVASGGTSLTPDQLRLVKKYSPNLTILYDGDSAGVKAALRGMDLALEEGLNVQLVLLPDQEDPDSYVRKTGPAAFRQFISANKKDFILFQLQLSLGEAAADTNKKALLVNQIAETISRINKAEDFTRQQDYIRRSAELLRIDEGGLLTLVNKFIRERVTKLTGRAASAEENNPAGTTPSPDFADDLTDLLNKDEQQERAIIRSLLEFGLKSWDDSRRVADFMLQEFFEEDMIDNRDLMRILETYKNWYREGLEPTARNFLYQEDQALSTLVVSVMDFPYEISPNWKEFYEGKIFSREELYKEEVISTLCYLKLRKIKRLMEMNQKDLEQARTQEEQHMFMQMHMHLKTMEKELLTAAGTVIVKS